MSHLSNKIMFIPLFLGCSIFVVFALYLLLGVDGNQQVALFLPGSDSQLNEIIFKVRLPRAAITSLTGGALAGAGVVSQGLFRNPLAGPSILGTSSGGVLASSLVILIFPYVEPWTLSFSGVLGAMFSTLLIVALSRYSKVQSSSMNYLILCGFALSLLLGAINSFILAVSLEDPSKSMQLIHRMMGSLSGSNWDQFLAMLPLVTIGIVLAYHISYQLNLMNLGYDIAHSLGVSWIRLSLLSILSIGLLVGTSTGFIGLVPFIGLLAPHVARKLIGPDHRQLISISMAIGVLICLVSDLFSRLIMYPTELPIGVMISLVGAPWLIYLLIQSERG